MKRNIIIGLLSLAVIATFTNEIMSANGKAGRTGSPGESNCTGCHNSFTVNTGGGSILLQCAAMSMWTYTPGTVYSMSVTVSRTGNPLFGIGLEALTSTNSNAGTLTVTDAAATQIKTATVNSVVRRNLVHQQNGGSGTGSKVFNFSWTAPATNVGNVTFYYAGIAANGNGNESGDYVYTGSQIIQASTTGVNEIANSTSISVYPNPASDVIHVSYKNENSGNVEINLFDLSGKLIQKRTSLSQQPGEHFESIGGLNNFPQGEYLLQTIVDGTSHVEKIMLQ